MKDGWYYDDDGNKVTQVMWELCEYDAEKAPHCIQARGMKALLKERGLWKKGLKRDDMRAIFKDQDDFKEDEDVILVQKAVKKYNKYADIDFFPKFHCELNPIENGWCYSKVNFRKAQDYLKKSDEQMRGLINKYLDQISIDTFRKFISTAILYSHAYETGQGGLEIMKKIKNLKKKRNSHRSVYFNFDNQ